MTRIVIADDHPIVLDGLKSLLASAGFTVAATCADGEAALAAIQRERPDIAVLDIQMPRLTGLQVMARARAAADAPRFVLLTATLDNRQVLEAIDRDADGLVLKETAADRIVECVETVARGEQWIDNDALKRVVSDKGARSEAARRRLTPREFDVARLAAQGLRNRAIAEAIGLTEGTVKMHLHNIYEKLAIDSRAELAARASALGVS